MYNVVSIYLFLACFPIDKEGIIKFLQIENWEVTKFLSAVWRSLSSAEKARNWKELAESDKKYFTSLACSMIDAD